MKRTQESLGNLVNYELITKVHPLEPPKVEKKDIPKFILCQNYDRAMQKVERTMERYNRKVNDLQARLQQSKNEIEALKAEFKLWEKRASEWVDRENPQAVTRHNDAVDQVRRLRDKISDATDKHNDLVDRHNEAIREAEEKLAELTEEALVAIDDDMVAVLDKSAQTATKFSGSENSEDLVAALETCFIGLKVFRSFEEHIEGNVARKDARERVTEVNKLCAELCANADVRNYLVDIFHRNAYLIQKNGELYAQVVKEIEGVDQRALDSMTQSFSTVFGKTFNTDFKYEGIVDPSRLETVVVAINKTIDAIKTNIAQVKELSESTKATAEAAVSVHRSAESILATMRGNLEQMRADLLFKGHFACEMIDEAVIDDFYHKELRPAVSALREYLVNQIGEEQIDALIAEDADRYSINKAESTIKKADLLRLQAQREQVDGHINKLSSMIKEAEGHINEVGKVPRKNAEAFRSSASTLYGLSWFPAFGFAFALGIQGKIKTFAPGFKSTNQVYRKLGDEILAKNKTWQMVNLVLAGILGIGGLFIFPELNVSSEVVVNISIPLITMALYLLTWAILGSAGKLLQSYMGTSKVASQTAPASETQ